MDFKDLVYLDAIDRYRNLTKAARTLYITQPALSNFLHSLETELHVELFRWNGNTMAPTPAGLEYLEFARTVLKDKKNLDNYMQLSAFGQGVLRIGIPFSRTASFVAPLVAFEKAYPQTEILLEEDAYINLNRKLSACELDLIFTNDPKPDSNHHLVPIFEDEILLYIPPSLAPEIQSACSFSNHPWIQLQTLAGFRFLVPPPDQMLGHMAEQIFAENNFQPTRRFQIKNITAQLQLAKAGYGICFYGHPLNTHWLSSEDEKSLYAFSTHPYTNTFAAAYSRKMKFPFIAEEFIRIVKTCCNLSDKTL